MLAGYYRRVGEDQKTYRPQEGIRIQRAIKRRWNVFWKARRSEGKLWVCLKCSSLRQRGWCLLLLFFLSVIHPQTPFITTTYPRCRVSVMALIKKIKQAKRKSLLLWWWWERELKARQTVYIAQSCHIVYHAMDGGESCWKDSADGLKSN